MGSVAELVAFAQQALLLGILVASPALAAGAVVSLATAAFQTATQIQDSTLAHLPRVIAVSVALVVSAPWMGTQLVELATRAFGMG